MIVIGGLCVLLVLISYRHYALLQSLKKLQQAINQKQATETRLLLTTPIQNQTLAELITQINTLFNELQQTKIRNHREKQLLDQAIHNITHDIRTPLTVASGFTQQLLRENSDPQLQSIRDNLQLVSKRLEILLDYQNLIEEALQPNLETLAFSPKVKEALLSYYEVLNEREFAVALDLQDGILVRGDQEMVERILQNIFSNVLKHGQEKLTVTLKKDQNYAQLTVANLCQQRIENVDQLTARFYSENMSETEASSGLGLYITQELVSLLDGLLIMEAVDAHFSIAIYLPLAEKIKHS